MEEHKNERRAQRGWPPGSRESRCSENGRREDTGQFPGRPTGLGHGRWGRGGVQVGLGLGAHAGGWVEGPLLTRETRRGTAEHGSCETQL